MKELKSLLVIGVLVAILVPQVKTQEGERVPTNEKGEIDRDSPEVQELLKENNLKPSESFRCGVFFAGKKFKDKPFEKLFIIPKRFPINQTYHSSDPEAPKRYSDHGACPIAKPYGTVDNPSVHNDTCYNIFINVVKKLKLEHDSFAKNPGKSIGDDTCNNLKKLGIKKMPANCRFPDGIPIGFYYNMCEDDTWYDTGLRLPQKLCCDPEKGLADPTYKACNTFTDAAFPKKCKCNSKFWEGKETPELCKGA